MSLGVLAVTAFLEALDPGAGVVSCTFPADAPEGRSIDVAVEARPSLRDADDRYRILLHLGSEHGVRGLAQPIDRTDERDVLIRAKAPDDVVYTIGLRDDGRAALNLLRVGKSAGRTRMETREGACRGHAALLKAWLRP